MVWTPPTGTYTNLREMPEHWLVDGYDISNYAFNVSKVSLAVPELRGDHTTLPQRSGIVPRFNRSYDAGELALSMWIIGAEVDGSIPKTRSARRALFERNLETLLTLFHHQSNFITLYKQNISPDGSDSVETRWARAVITGSTSMETMAARQRAEITFTFKLIDAHWSVSTPIVESSIASATLPQTITLTGMGSAPVEDALVTITGPITNPTVSCYDSGTTVSYAGTVATGQTLVLDSGQWKANIASTNVTGSISNTGHARWIYIPPRGSAAVDAVALLQPRLTLTGTSASTATKFSVSYKKRYLLP